MALLIAVAAVVVTTDSMAQGAPVEQATDEQKTQAREHFTKAKQAFTAKRYDEALTELRASYDIVASPNSRIMIVQVLDAMGRTAEAYDESVAVVSEAEGAATADPKYERTAEAARQLRDAIRPNVGIVNVSVPPDATGTLTVNGREIAPGSWEEPIAVAPGMVTVQLDENPAEQVSVEAGGEASVDLTAAPPPPPPPPPPEEDDEGFHLKNKRTIAYISGGVGAAGLIMFGIFGGLASSTYSDIDDQCPNKTNCAAELEEDADSGSTYQTVANVSLVIGIVGVAAGAGFFVWDLLDPDDADSDQSDDGDDYAIVRPQVVVGPGSLSIRGSF
jgi:hypothetical protein